MQVVRRPEVIDDFIRNFLIHHKMERTLEAFQVSLFDFPPTCSPLWRSGKEILLLRKCSCRMNLCTHLPSNVQTYMSTRTALTHLHHSMHSRSRTHECIHLYPRNIHGNLFLETHSTGVVERPHDHTLFLFFIFLK